VTLALGEDSEALARATRSWCAVAVEGLTGEAWFNEVFLDDVFVPDDCVIGAVDDGWRAGRTTLANERVAMGSSASVGAGVRSLVDLLGEGASPVDVDRVGHLVACDHALGAVRTRMLLRACPAPMPGPRRACSSSSACSTIRTCRRPGSSCSARPRPRPTAMPPAGCGRSSGTGA
jgi:hypothetical protein